MIQDQDQSQDENSPAFDEFKTWVESVLTKYYRGQYSRKELIRLGLTLALNKPTTPALLRKQKGFSLPGRTVGIETDKEDPVVRIRDMNILNAPENSPAPGIRATVRYTIGSSPVQYLEHYILRASKRLEPPRSERYLVQVICRDQCEIDFYVNIAPLIEDKLNQDEIGEKVGLIKCVYGKYVLEEVESTEQVLDPAAVEIEEAFGIKMKSEAVKSLRNEMHSILITEDVERLNFRRGSGLLSFNQTKAALKQLALIHSATYCIHLEKTRDLPDLWTFLLDPRQSFRIAKQLVARGFNSFYEYVSQWMPDNDPDRESLLNFLKIIQSKLDKVFNALTAPGKFPSTLLHMDFHKENLFFRQTNPSTSTTSSDQANNNTAETETECLISNWKIVSYGPPTHDVAYLLLSSIDPDIRQRHTSEFVLDYYQTFLSIARKLLVPVTFTLRDLKTEYERSFFLVLLLVIGNFHEGHTFGGAISRMYINGLRTVSKSQFAIDLFKAI